MGKSMLGLGEEMIYRLKIREPPGSTDGSPRGAREPSRSWQVRKRMRSHTKYIESNRRGS
jgi:hypothetical protein